MEWVCLCNIPDSDRLSAESSSGTKFSKSKFETNDLSTLSTPISCWVFFPASAFPQAVFSSLEKLTWWICNRR